VKPTSPTVISAATVLGDQFPVKPRALRTEAVAFLVVGQAAFLAMMGACLAARPSLLALKRGLRFYGNDADTVVPFALGIAAGVARTALGLARIRATENGGRRFRRGAVSIVALTLLIPLTPYSVDPIVDYLHIGVSSALFAAAFFFGIWIAWRLLRHRVAVAASTAQFLAGLLALSAQVGWSDLMIPAQLGFEVACGALLVLGAAKVATQAG